MAEDIKPSKQVKPVRQKRDWSVEGELPYERIPAFKAAYDCYKECQFRFRNVPIDSKPIAREVKEKLMRTMVCIAHARLNIHVLESLQEAMDLALEIQITIRVLVETNAITKKDFANITKYSENLVRQMVGWAASEEKKGKGDNRQAPDRNKEIIDDTKNNNNNQGQLSLFDNV